MVNRGLILLAFVTVTAVSIALLAGRGPWAGPDLLGITETHGLHVGDLPILAGWVASAGCCWWVWRRQ